MAQMENKHNHKITLSLEKIQMLQYIKYKEALISNVMLKSWMLCAMANKFVADNEERHIMSGI